MTERTIVGLRPSQAAEAGDQRILSGQVRITTARPATEASPDTMGRQLRLLQHEKETTPFEATALTVLLHLELGKDEDRQSRLHHSDAARPLKFPGGENHRWMLMGDQGNTAIATTVMKEDIIDRRNIIDDPTKPTVMGRIGRPIDEPTQRRASQTTIVTGVNQSLVDAPLLAAAPFTITLTKSVDAMMNYPPVVATRLCPVGVMIRDATVLIMTTKMEKQSERPKLPHRHSRVCVTLLGPMDGATVVVGMMANATERALTYGPMEASTLDNTRMEFAMELGKFWRLHNLNHTRNAKRLTASFFLSISTEPLLERMAVNMKVNSAMASDADVVFNTTPMDLSFTTADGRKTSRSHKQGSVFCW